MAMATSRLIFLSLAIFIQFSALITAQPNYRYCYSTGNFTNNSTYQSNLNQVLSSITSDTQINYGFYNLSSGQINNNIVHAIGLCRGDVKPEICRSCLTNSTQDIKNLCPIQKEAIVWYDNCMLRYSNRPIYGILIDITPWFWMDIKDNVSNPSEFNQAVNSLLGNLTSVAASGDSRLKFATGNTTIASSQTIFGLVQCTPDLSMEDCNECLTNITRILPQCCDGRQGGRVICPSCNLRYEISQFYDSSPVSAPAPTLDSPPPPPMNNTGPATTRVKGSNGSKAIIIIVISVTVFVVLVIVMIFIYLRSKKPKTEITRVDEIMTVESLQYEFSFIRAATDNFSESNKLGQGGFGPVYKGTFPNKQVVAVKRLSKESSQGEVEFKNEVLLLAKLHNRNLVRLLGFCFEREERLLIYEFMPNLSLSNFLSGDTKCAQLDWKSRYNIIYGIVRGLIYLHEESQHRIIHRDLKASNILLDASLNAKIADFGTARLFSNDQTQDETSRIVGTYGYMAPEYVANGHFSAKSDVYSFGVIVLEVVSGQKNGCFRVGEDAMDLKTYAWQSWNQGTALNLIDLTISSGPTSEMMRCIHIGLLCVQENEASRPTMALVGVMLSSYSVSLPQPSKPAFFMQSTLKEDIRLEHQNSVSIDSDQSNWKFGHSSINEASITELNPR